jgi:hypothetical protein
MYPEQCCALWGYGVWRQTQYSCCQLETYEKWNTTPQNMKQKKIFFKNKCSSIFVSYCILQNPEPEFFTDRWYSSSWFTLFWFYYPQVYKWTTGSVGRPVFAVRTYTTKLWPSACKMVAARTYTVSINFKQTARRTNPGHTHLHRYPDTWPYYW